MAALLGAADIGKVIDLQQRDFFDLAAPDLGRRRGLVALNPPYGHRLGKPEATPRLIGGILRKLQRDFVGWQVLLVLPEKRLLRQVPFAVVSYRVVHGGRPVWLAIGSVPP